MSFTTEPSKYGVDDDRSFGATIADFNGFVGAVFVSQTTGIERKWPGAVPEPRFRIGGLEQWLAETGAGGIAFPRAAFPVPEIAAGASVLANVHLDPDPDSVYRRVKIFSVFDGKILPSLGLGAYLAASPDASLNIVPGAFSIGDRRVSIDGEGSAILNFRGPSGTHRAYSAASIIQSELRIRNGEPPTIKDTEAFRDSYVFFGMSAPGLFDLRPAPVSGVYPGVEIHATILDNLLSNDFIRAVPVSILAALTLLMALMAGVGTSYVSGIFKSFTVYAASIILPVAVCLIAYARGFWLPLIVQEVGGNHHAVQRRVDLLFHGGEAEALHQERLQTVSESRGHRRAHPASGAPETGRGEAGAVHLLLGPGRASPASPRGWSRKR